mmetsp:Transcript_182/g.673  ORF Transcript_182/g.673 Transcript_182/m.673 type:complete len:224 (+) Transcript_182:183-854(+)
MAVGGAGREGGGEEGELVRAEVADAGANLVGEVLGVRSKRLAEARESEAEPAELPGSQLCTPARGFGRQRRADPPGAVLRQSGGEGGGDADELGRGCGGEERAAACRSVAQPLRNSGKHVRHRNLASGVERTEGARQLERVCGAECVGRRERRRREGGPEGLPGIGLPEAGSPDAIRGVCDVPAGHLRRERRRRDADGAKGAPLVPERPLSLGRLGEGETTGA